MKAAGKEGFGFDLRTKRLLVPRTLVQVTDLGDGTARIQLDLTLPWEEMLRLLGAIPSASKNADPK